MTDESYPVTRPDAWPSFRHAHQVNRQRPLTFKGSAQMRAVSRVAPINQAEAIRPGGGPHQAGRTSCHRQLPQAASTSPAWARSTRSLRPDSRARFDEALETILLSSPTPQVPSPGSAGDSPDFAGRDCDCCYGAQAIRSAS
jgi:hypothetical protein